MTHARPLSRKPRPAHLSDPATLDRIRELWAGQMTLAEICADVGTFHKTLRKIATELGLPERARCKRKNDIDLAVFAEMWSARIGGVTMARHFHVDKQTIYNTARDLGLPARLRGPGAKAKGAQNKGEQYTKPRPEPAATAPREIWLRPDYPAINAAVARGVTPRCLAATFRLEYRAACELAGVRG